MKMDRTRILIVDDIPMNIKVLGEALRKEYAVSLATSGSKALEIASAQPQPDLILLDIMMPDMDGYEVCRRLKSDARTHAIPIIFVTAKTAMVDEVRGFDLGAVDYISKPFSIPIVMARVKTHLELKRKSDLLEQLTCTDALTNIANRRRLDESLQQEWNRQRRSAAPLSVIFADIDYFKRFNDHYGHQAGDECLMRVAAIFKDSLARSTDFIARYGGEEFVALLPETETKAAMAMAEKMRAHVEQAAIPHTASEIADHVTLSLGVVTAIPTSDDQPEQLLQQADDALYAAKAGGRNRVVQAPSTP